MARPKGSFKTQPAYRLHKRSGQAVVTIAGRDHYLGPFGTRATSLKSWQQYDRLIGEFLIGGGAGTDLLLDGGVTITELCAAFFAELQGSSSVSSQWRVTVKALREAYGDTLARDFGPLALKALRQRLVVKRCTCGGRQVYASVDEAKLRPTRKRYPITYKMAGQTLSRTYVNRLIKYVTLIFKWAVAHEMVPGSLYHALQTVEPLQAGRTGARETPKVRPASDEQIEAVLGCLTPTLAAMVRVHLLAGMRSSEVCAMRGCDIDTTGPHFKKWGVWAYRPASHKTQNYGVERVIYLGKQAQELLRPYLGPNLTAHLFSPRRSEVERRALARTKLKARVLAYVADHPSCRSVREICRGIGANFHYTYYATSELAQEGAPGLEWYRPKRRPREQRRGLADRESFTKCTYRDSIFRACVKAKVAPWFPHQLRHYRATAVAGTYGDDAARAVLSHTTQKTTKRYIDERKIVSPDQETTARIMAEVG